MSNASAPAEAFMASSSSYLTTPGGPAKNAFYEHRQDSIRFGYRCFEPSKADTNEETALLSAPSWRPAFDVADMLSSARHLVGLGMRVAERS
jgi:hypothetical protein